MVLLGEAEKHVFSNQNFDIYQNIKNIQQIQNIIQKSTKIQVFLGFPVDLWACGAPCGILLLSLRGASLLVWPFS